MQKDSLLLNKNDNLSPCFYITEAFFAEKYRYLAEFSLISLQEVTKSLFK
jgi:hypothetical protein